MDLHHVPTIFPNVSLIIPTFAVVASVCFFFKLLDSNMTGPGETSDTEPNGNNEKLWTFFEYHFWFVFLCIARLNAWVPGFLPVCALKNIPSEIGSRVDT